MKRKSVLPPTYLYASIVIVVALHFIFPVKTYLGFVFILFGLAVLLGSLTPFLIIPVFAIVMDRHFILVKERMLSETFGQAWLGYRARVRRWV